MPRVPEILRDAQTLADFSNLEPRKAEYFRNNYPEFAPKAWWDKQIAIRNEALERELMKQMNDSMQKSPDAQVEEGWDWPEEGLFGKGYLEKIKLVHAEVESNPLYISQWRVTQAYLRDWWKSRFKDDVQFLVLLLNSVFDPDPQTNAARMVEYAVRQHSSSGVPGGDVIGIEIPGHKDIRRMWSRSNLREGYIPMQGAIVYLFGSPWRARFCAECKKRFVAAEPRNKFCGETCYREHRLRQARKSWHKHKNEWRPPKPAKEQKLKKGKGK